MEDIGALLGSGNDQVGNWTFWSYTALEGWSYNHYAGGDTEIWLNNRGFDHNQIPPGQDPYNP